MHQPMLVERFGERGNSQASWSMHEDWAKREELPFDFRKMFAAIALNIGSTTVRRGYFCDVAMEEQVPRYLKGYPDILQELICSLADHSLSQIRNGGMVIKVDSVPVKNGERHLVTVGISDTARNFLGRCAALETILERYSAAEQHFLRDGSSWIFWERQLKSPLNGKIVIQSRSRWGSKYRIEIELGSLARQGDSTNPQ